METAGETRDFEIESFANFLAKVFDFFWFVSCNANLIKMHFSILVLISRETDLNGNAMREMKPIKFNFQDC